MWLNHIWTLKPILVTIFAFVAPLYLPIEFSPDCEQVQKCAYVIIVMAILWLTEAIPIPVTSLMPIFLFPMLGVATAKHMSGSYVTDTTMLFLGGLIIAVALEETGLHRRISLCVMMLVGAQPIWIMAGLMVTTWFLSMWISNTAATSMMVPIITAIISTVKDVRAGIRVTGGEENEAYEMEDDLPNGNSRESIPRHEVSRRPKNAQKYKLNEDTESVYSSSRDPEMNRLAKGFALSVAYGANIGGIATLTGTPPNLVLKEKADDVYRDYGYTGSESQITFAQWMGFAFPLSLITVILGWIWLSLVFLRCSCFKKMEEEQKNAINHTIRTEFKKLGFISLAEFEVLVVFIILVVLWLFRAPPNIDGWGIAFEKGFVSDSTPCILLSVLLFILPSEVPKVFCNLKEGHPSYKPILTWQVVAAKLSWGVILLLGGGFAIASASTSSGLSQWVGTKLSKFDNLDEWVLNLIVCAIVAAGTEVTSNTATANLILPILAELAVVTGIHPLYLMISATVACSFAFMLPVATPPNAIVFSTGYLTVLDMFTTGIPMNIIALLSLTLAINTWGKSMYGLDTLPDIFVNVTQDRQEGFC